MAAAKKITIDQAIDLLNEAFGIDPVKTGRSVYSKRTIYNAIQTKRITRYGPHHMVQLDSEEILRVFGPKKVG